MNIQDAPGKPWIEIAANGMLFDGRVFTFQAKAVTADDPNDLSITAWRLEFK